MRTLLKWSFLLIVLLAVFSVMLLSASIYTFHRLTDETLIAELRFDQTGDRQYVAHLRTGDGCDGARAAGARRPMARRRASSSSGSTGRSCSGSIRSIGSTGSRAATARRPSRTPQPNIAHDLAGGTALDVVGVAGALGTWNFLIDATYGSSTYEDIDTASVYNVYRTQTGIITRTAPRPVAVPGEPLPVEIKRACGAEAPLWERVTTWTDERVVSAARFCSP